MKKGIILFLKGFLMGICDLIPGISGGTIAFITGIYERLISAVKSISPKLFYDFFMFIFKKENKLDLIEDIKKLDLYFLISVLFGIISAILLGSRIIDFLLENYFIYTISFFIGLILASSKIIFSYIKDHKLKNRLFGIIGFVLGILLIFLVPVNASPSLGYVFFGGLIAISAMFLPGISGAFILLIMGLYEFMINVLQNISANFGYLTVFLLGIILGAFIISRVISFVLTKHKCKTLYLLLGLVIGSLSIPIKRIFTTTILNLSNFFLMIVFLILGVLLVTLVSKYSK